jgi:hypothetical protein
MRPRAESLNMTMEKELQSFALLLESCETQKLIYRKMTKDKDKKTIKKETPN